MVRSAERVSRTMKARISPCGHPSRRPLRGLLRMRPESLSRRKLKSQHARQHAIRRLVGVEEGADFDDHLLAHLDAALDRGRAPMRQQRHLAGLGAPHQLRVHRGLVLIDIEAGAADLTAVSPAGRSQEPWVRSPPISPPAISLISVSSSVPPPRAVLTM